MGGQRREVAWCAWAVPAAVLAACILAAPGPTDARKDRSPAQDAKRNRLRAELKALPHRIVYESLRGTQWDLLMVHADGSNPVNLTKTADVNELYPHASPDGSKICFLADEGTGRSKVRSVYYMDAPAPSGAAAPAGAARKLVARNARHPCWGPAGRRIAYTPDEYPRFSYRSYATKGITVYDLAAGTRREHPNPAVKHLYALKWSPDGRWFLATVHGALGHDHADLAIEAEGTGVYRLKIINGCRPDVRADGKKVVWNATDHAIAVADLDLTTSPPTVSNPRQVVTCDKDHEVYHADFSPDGRYIAFAHGPRGSQAVGMRAPGWHICVADVRETNVCVVLTRDGASNKEPDWVPVGKGPRK